MTTRREFITGSGALAGITLSGVQQSAFAAGADRKAFLAEMRHIERGVRGRLGVAVLDTGSRVQIGYRTLERFPMCSTFKLVVGALVLKRVDDGKETLGRRIVVSQKDILANSPATEKHIGGDGMTVAELCEAAITLSDNAAANLLLASFGGPPAITAFARALGDGVTRLDRNEPTLNEAIPRDPRDTTSPAAMLNTIRKLALENALTPSSRDQLTQWLLANKTGDARLRAQLPAGWRVGDKTGTGNRGSTNDIGILWPPQGAPIVVTAYLTETTASAQQRDAAIAAVGKAVAALRS